MTFENTTEIIHDCSSHIRIFKDGSVERLLNVPTIPPSYDLKTRVQSKDVTISPGLSARIYLPLSLEGKFPPKSTKLPLYVYFHAGAFCLNSSATYTIHNYMNKIARQAKVIAVSVDYRLAPEHPIPACYDDSWAAVQWVESHSDRSGPDPWLNKWGDFDRFFLAGDSAGANIVHDMIVRAGPGGSLGMGTKVSGMLLLHPFFGDGEPNALWDFLCPKSFGSLDPRLNPAADPARMREDVGCGRVLVCVDKEDWLKARGTRYYETLTKNGWKGEVEFVETNGGGHVFHVSLKPESDEAVMLVKKIASFVNAKPKASNEQNGQFQLISKML